MKYLTVIVFENNHTGYESVDGVTDYYSSTFGIEISVAQPLRSDEREKKLNREQWIAKEI